MGWVLFGLKLCNGSFQLVNEILVRCFDLSFLFNSQCS